jgi:hypothetical protein
MSGVEQRFDREAFGCETPGEIPVRNGLHEIPGQLRRRAFPDDHALSASLAQHTRRAKQFKEPFR